MHDAYASFEAKIRRLAQAVEGLRPLAAQVGAAPPDGREWFDLLHRRLLAQLDLPPLLIVAIVGGTNTGKSVVFNHLAGEVASAATPLAAGTKHPVCLVPPASDDAALVARLFEGFHARPWHAADDPLQESDDDLLFWRRGANVPERLVLVDAPDVDSDATVNWNRARAVRQTADVLVALLTQQKYNDAAVKEFFRAAVESDKPIVVLFNFCDLVEDRDYWPQWLARFCAETGAKPELVYLSPYDRAAANSLQLEFHQVSASTRLPGEGTRGNLRDELASLHFDAIKIRTFRGALRQVLDIRHGLPNYLAGLTAAAEQFTAAAKAILTASRFPIIWPTLPTGVLVEEIRLWWDADRSGWSRKIHGFYRNVGRGVTWPFRAAWESYAGPAGDLLANFHQQERTAVVLAVEKLLDELDRLAQVGNDILRPRLLRMLGGRQRAELLAHVEAAHRQLPAVDEDYRQFLCRELDEWKESNRAAVRFLRTLDHAMAVARPAITVSLVVSGWVVAGGVVHQAAVQAMGHTAGQLATEAAITGGITGGGEVLVSTTSEGVRQAAARLFRRLQARYAEQRAAWLAGYLERELFGDLLADLRHGAELPVSPAFHEAEATVAELTL